MVRITNATGSEADLHGAYNPLNPYGHPLTLITGWADGIDRMADRLAQELGWKGLLRFPAEWDHYRSIGKWKSAGMQRNLEMIQTLPPDICLAFPGPDSKGTWGMVRLCEDWGTHVKVFQV